MSQSAFTQGIELGGLTTDYETRMLVCWLLYKLDTPVTMQQLNLALQRHGLVNYFELANAVSLLLASNHLLETEEDPEKEHPMVVTDLGIQTAVTFERNIPLNVREKSLSSAKESLLLERLEKENKVSITKTEDGYRLQLAIADVGTDLLELSMYLPTQELCEKMKRRFLTDPTVIYRAAIRALGDEELGGSSLRD